MKRVLDVSFIVVGVACAIYTLVFFARLPVRVWQRAKALKEARSSDVERKR